MSTVANVKNSDSNHWYYTDGRPCYELPKKDGSGMKVPTLADARKLNLLPSVTTILKILHKQGLVDWLIEQAVLAAITSPKLQGESDDAFVYRVLHTERQQDQEAQIARDRGTAIHDCLQELARGQKTDPEIAEWCLPAFEAIRSRGTIIETEYCICGEGYAGKLDLAQETPDAIWLWDWKTAKKLPSKGPWPEHVLQLSAYAEAWLMRQCTPDKRIRTGNVYISTVTQGNFLICEHDPWEQTFACGFAPLVRHWQWSTGYTPKQ